MKDILRFDKITCLFYVKYINYFIYKNKYNNLKKLINLKNMNKI